MDRAQIALSLAGIVGGATSIVHGILMQRVMIVPQRERSAAAPRAMVKLTELLLHYTTFAWLLCGAMLIVAALWLGSEARVVTGIIAGASFAYGAIAQLWSMRRPHPGWILMTIACVLIVVGLA